MNNFELVELEQRSSAELLKIVETEELSDAMREVLNEYVYHLQFIEQVLGKRKEYRALVSEGKHDEARAFRDGLREGVRRAFDSMPEV